MGKNVGELYSRAVKCHFEGELDRAIKICEKAISKDFSNGPALNLKGLIFYQKGELDKAIEVWNINREINNDQMAKAYIEDSINDRGKILLYDEAEKLIKNLAIDKGIDILNKCAESDFNTIKVNTSLGYCYYKKGEAKKAKEYLIKALSVDRKYDVAKSLLKEIDEVYKEERFKDKNKIYILTFLLSLILGISFSIYALIKGNQDMVNLTSDNEISEKEDFKYDKEFEDNNEKENKEDYNLKDKNASIFKIKEVLGSGDLYTLVEIINIVDEKSLSGDEKKLYNEAIKKLSIDGVEKFYNKGIDYFSNKEYEKAMEEFKLALIYSKHSYLNEHILYFSGLTEYELKNDKESIEYLEKYYKYYPDGTYKEEVLYKLARINEKYNIDESKLYARILKEKYANSMYNNENIDKILNK